MHVVTLIEILGETAIPARMRLIVPWIKPLIEFGVSTTAQTNRDLDAVAYAKSRFFTQALRVADH